jgi:hypothetical protein
LINAQIGSDPDSLRVTAVNVNGVDRNGRQSGADIGPAVAAVV